LLERIGFEPTNPLTLRNSLSSDMMTLRTDLLPNMLGVLERNATRQAEFGTFEVARVFTDRKDAAGTIVQPNHLSVALYDRGARTGEAATVLFCRMKGILAQLFERLDLDGVDLSGPCKDSRPWIHPIRNMCVKLGERVVGYACGLHPETLGALDCLGSAVLAEIDLDALLELPVRPRLFAEISKYPAITVDISLHVGQRVNVGSVDRLIHQHGGEYLSEVAFVAEYVGASVPEGCKSVTFRLTYRAAGRTLSQGEVDAEAIKAKLQGAVQHLEG